MLYTGRIVPADEAKRIGLLKQIVPAAKLIEAAVEMGQMIAKNDARMVQGISGCCTRAWGSTGRAPTTSRTRRADLPRRRPPARRFKDLARKPAR